MIRPLVCVAIYFMLHCVIARKDEALRLRRSPARFCALRSPCDAKRVATSVRPHVQAQRYPANRFGFPTER